MKVFISYRRDDTQVASTHIYRELSQKVGPENIFFDVDNIPFGVNSKTYSSERGRRLWGDAGHHRQGVGRRTRR